jgi:hypothetical protein
MTEPQTTIEHSADEATPQSPSASQNSEQSQASSPAPAAQVADGKTQVPENHVKPVKAEGAEAIAPASGVPGDASGYQIWSPEGKGWGSEQSAIQEFLTDAHGAGLSQAQLDVALQSLARANATRAQAVREHQNKQLNTCVAELRKEWGAAFQEVRTLADAEAQKIWGGEAPDVMNIKLADGTRLGDTLWFVKGLGEMVRQKNATPGKRDREQPDGPDRDRLTDLYALMRMDPKKYRSAPIQAEIRDIEAKRIGRGNEGNAGAPDTRLDGLYKLQRDDPKRYRSAEVQREIIELEARRLGR